MRLQTQVHRRPALAPHPALSLALGRHWTIAPLDEDVWDIAAFDGSTHVSAPEREAFESFINSGFTELTREHTPGPGTYTYWDYQKLRFPKREGMRIDFILGSPALAAVVDTAWIDRDERKGKGASDHAPVVVDLKLD